MIYLGTLKTKFRFENIYLASLIMLSIVIRILQAMSKRDYIHVIGDSHVFSFTNINFKVHYLGPVTAYNLNKDNTKTRGKERLFRTVSKICSDELIILIFGEIDSRIHIYNQYMKRNKEDDIKELIRDTVENYGSVIKTMKSAKQNKIAILNVLPPGEQDNIYGYLFYADRQTRLKITLEFNRQLKQWCRLNGTIYIDVFEKLVDKDGERIRRYTLDRTHYNNKISDIVLSYLKTL